MYFCMMRQLELPRRPALPCSGNLPHFSSMFADNPEYNSSI